MLLEDLFLLSQLGGLGILQYFKENPHPNFALI